MRTADLVTWAILILIAAEASGNTGADAGSVQNQMQTGQCSYAFGAQEQSSVTAPFWIRNICNPNNKPWVFQSE